MPAGVTFPIAGGGTAAHGENTKAGREPAVSLSIFSLVGPAAVLPSFNEMLTPECWSALYHRGQFGSIKSVILLVLVHLVVAAGILLAARVAVMLTRRFIAHGIGLAMSRSTQGQRRLTTLQGLLSSTLSYVIYFFAIIFTLFALGVTSQTLAPLWAAASVLGLAVGFGAQRLVRDVITGLFILGEGQFDVGDWVTIGTVSGRVEDIGLRVTRLRDEQGREYIISNGDITQTFNASRGLLRLPIELILPRSAPLDMALVEIHNVAEVVLAEFSVVPATGHEAPTVLVTGMDAAKITVRLVLWTPVQTKDAIEDALRRRLLDTMAQTTSPLTLA